MKMPWYIRKQPVSALVAGLGGLVTSANLACGYGGWLAMAAPVAISADGVKMVAAIQSWEQIWFLECGSAPLCVSADAGATWTPANSPAEVWRAIAMSADGSTLAAATDSYWGGTIGFIGGTIYRSLDSGVTWMVTSAPNAFWSSIASSADGVKMVAVALADASGNVGTGRIYCSTNSGATWAQCSAPSTNWACVASSADGTRLFAATFGSGNNGGSVISPPWIPGLPGRRPARSASLAPRSPHRRMA